MKLIPVVERFPEPGQSVIAFNGTKLVAAIYFPSDNSQYSFQVEKYSNTNDRVTISYWNNITHWMPITLSD